MYLMVCLLFVVLVPRADAVTKDDIKLLHSSLLPFYNNEVLPVYRIAAVVVGMNFHLISIEGLDEKGQTLVTDAYVSLGWFDEELKWNPDENAGLQFLTVSQSKIWVPDVIVRNSVEDRKALGYDAFRLAIGYDGFVAWDPAIRIKSACDLNIRYYTLDTQHCAIQFTSASMIYTELYFQIVNDTVILDEFSPNGQWELTTTSVVLENVTTKTLKQMIIVNMTLKRRFPFYLVNIVLPIIILSSLGSVVFVLPAESGEKMSLSITVLLAYVVFLTIVTDNIPHTSLQTSLLAVYLIVLVSTSALSVVLTAIVLRFYHKRESVPVPRSFVLFVKLLGRKKSSKGVVATANAVVAPNEVRCEEISDKSTVEAFDVVNWMDVSIAFDFVFFIFSLCLTVIASTVYLVLLTSG